MKAVVILAVLIIGAMPLHGLQPEPEVLSVCDILRDPVQYNGKIIAVRGFLVSTDEGSWLHGECKEPLITNGYKWASMIWPESPTSGFALHKAPFEEDVLAQREMWATRDREITDRRDRLWVTYIGLLETRPTMNLEVFVRPNGQRQPVGFGHLGGAPAQLLVKTVKDVVVEHTKEAK
jgi:hypothetical protein